MAKVVMATLAQGPHILQVIDRFGIRSESDCLQFHGSLRPTEQLDKFPKVNGLLVLNRVRDDMRHIGCFGVAYLAVRIADATKPTHFMRAKGADDLAVGTNPLPFPGATRSTGFGSLIPGTSLGWLFDAATASKGSKDKEPRFDNIHKILDLIARLFR